MAVTAGMLARAAATALSNEKLRKGIGWGLVAVLSPVILLIAALCSIGTGGADHNNQAVAAAFYGTSYSTEVPMAFRSHIEEMRTAFSLLDSAVASVNGQTEFSKTTSSKATPSMKNSVVNSCRICGSWFRL